MVYVEVMLAWNPSISHPTLFHCLLGVKKSTGVDFSTMLTIIMHKADCNRHAC